MYAIRPVTLFSPFFFEAESLSFASSLSKTASTSIGGLRESDCARFHRWSLVMPIQGPYSDDRSKWRRIFSKIGSFSWWTIADVLAYRDSLQFSCYESVEWKTWVGYTYLWALVWSPLRPSNIFSLVHLRSCSLASLLPQTKFLRLRR